MLFHQAACCFNRCGGRQCWGRHGQSSQLRTPPLPTLKVLKVLKVLYPYPLGPTLTRGTRTRRRSASGATCANSVRSQSPPDCLQFHTLHLTPSLHSSTTAFTAGHAPSFTAGRVCLTAPYLTASYHVTLPICSRRASSAAYSPAGLPSPHRGQERPVQASVVAAPSPAHVTEGIYPRGTHINNTDRHPGPRLIGGVKAHAVLSVLQCLPVRVVELGRTRTGAGRVVQCNLEAMTTSLITAQG